MKRFLLLILCLALSVAMLAFMTSCGDDDTGDSGNGENGGDDGNGDNACTEHYDGAGDGVCDLCGDTMPSETSSVKFTVKDQDGAKISGVTVIFTSKTDSKNVVKTAVSGADGVVTAELKHGIYNLDYEYDNSVTGYFLIDTYTVTISADTKTLDLLLINNTPNGTVSRPYPIDIGENAIDIASKKTDNFIVYHAINLYVTIEGEGIKVTYNGEEKTAEGGVISFDLIGEDTNASAIISIENLTESKASVLLTVNGKPGTHSNPVAIDELGVTFSTEGYEVETVYYTYTAEADGTFCVKLTSENSFIRLQNNITSNDSENNADEDGVTSITVKAGDIVMLDCSATDLNANDDITPFVTFIPGFVPAE